MDHTEYIPGTCNIGKEEVGLRKGSFYIALVATIAIFIYNLLMPLNYVNLLLLFFATILTGINFQQYRNRFCIKYGWFHQFNFGKRGMKQTIQDKKLMAMDRKKVIEIISKAVLFAVLISGLVCLVHVLM